MEGMQSLFPNRPQKPKKKKRWKPTPASELTDKVIKFFKERGHAARRVNSSGQYDEEQQKWRPSGMKRGFEDVDVTISVRDLNNKPYLGLKLAVEIKCGRDTSSEYQEKRAAELEAVGADYWIVTDMNMLESLYGKLMVIDIPKRMEQWQL